MKCVGVREAHPHAFLHFTEEETMTTAATETTTEKTPAPAAGAPAASKAPETPAAPAAAATPAPAAPTTEELGDDTEPTAGKKYTLTAEALRKRVDRGSKAFIKSEFGIDDPAVIKSKLAAADAAEKAAEEARRAQLTKEQQLTEDLRVANEARQAAELRAQEVEEAREIGTAEDAIRESLKETIKPKFWRHVRADLAEHLSSKFDPDKLDAMTDQEREKIVGDWATQYVRDNPEYAAKAERPAGGATEQKTEEKKPEAAKVPLTNGTANPAGAGPTGGKAPPVITTGKFAGKTAAPGHPNSMTKAEFEQWKRETGNRF